MILLFGKNSNKYLTNISIGFLVVFSVLICFFWFRSTNNSEIKELGNEVTQLQKSINFYESETDGLSIDSVNSKIIDDGLDVKQLIGDKKIKISDGISKVYNETKTEEDYKKLQEELPSIVGESLSNLLIELASPKLNQTGNKAFPYGKLLNATITYGKYEVETNIIPCFILVDYQSPAINATSTGIKTEEKEAFIQGKDFFILNYNLKDDEIAVVDYQQNIGEVTTND